MLFFDRMAFRLLKNQSMWDVVISVVALIAGAVILELFTATKAPYGYQDERGFHFGVEPRKGTPHPQQKKA